MNTRNTMLMLVAAGALVLGALAVPAIAQPDQADDRARDRMPDHARNRTAAAADHAPDAECDDNETACDEGHGKQARRSAHAILHAIDALEHRVVKLEMREMRISEALEDGNLSANETADLEAQLERIQGLQDRMLLKIQDLEHKLEALKERWQAVQDHARSHQRILVCHVDEEGDSHTLRVAGPAARAHLDHGDAEGACADDETEDDVDDGSEHEVDDESDEDGGDEDDE